ncbi:MAG: 3-hydroxyacyl-CoA dehydrogenase family protein [Acidobacteria bacterium]|nr:3-hydroxyacyl-CoA dehydrogenase family protein [Acidobacteriota bacterium]
MKNFEIRNVAVIGSGAMGQGIAQCFAQAGLSVRLTDSRAEALVSARDKIAEQLGQAARAGIISSAQTEATLGRIQFVASLEEAAQTAEFVTESVSEQLAVKHRLFQQLEQLVPSTCILASNTSSLSLSAIAAPLADKTRIVLTHYFNPAHLLPAVEVLGLPETRADVLQATMALLKSTGKVPLLLRKEVPGLVVNRVQAAMAREVFALLDAGVATAEEIDAAIRGSIGMRLPFLGPFATLDAGGLDVWQAVLKNLFPELSNAADSPLSLDKKVEAGQLGTKSGQGFYSWTDKSSHNFAEWRNERLIQLKKIL